jgi:hypothetical protein
MTEKEIILQELQSISPLLPSVPQINVYKVDVNYFDGLRAELQARIIADGFAGVNQKLEVPVGYFDNLSTNVLQRIKALENNEVLTELEGVSPVVAAIGNKNVYQVPQGYFEQLAFVNKDTAAVVKMNPLRKIFKYAAAAAVVGIISVGAFKFANRDISPTMDANTKEVVKQGNEIIKNGSFDTELENISDKDLEKYLSQNGEDVKAALVASTIDNEKALPEVDDYLMDDNTLNEFLKNNNINN